MSRAGLHIGCAAVATGIGATGLWIHGPLPVTVTHYALEHVAPFWYMLAAFPFYGALAGEALWHRREGHRRDAGVLAAQLLALGLLGMLRLVLRVPISGHVMLQGFFVAELHRAPAGRLRQVELVAGFAGLAGFLWIKLVEWQDWITPPAGLAAAAFVAGAGAIARRR